MTTAGAGGCPPAPATGPGRGRSPARCSPDGPAQHVLHLRDEVVQRRRLEVQHLLPAEREELAGERGGRFPGFPDLPELGRPGVSGLRAGEEDVAVADDDGQQVVEVVRDPSRQAPHRLHLLRLPELFLQPHAVRDVARDRENVFSPSMSITRADISPVSIRPSFRRNFASKLRTSPCSASLRTSSSHRGIVPDVQAERVLADDVLDFVPVPGEPLVDLDEQAVAHAVDVHGVGRDPERLGELLLRKAQRPLHPLVVGEVAADARHADGGAVLRVADQEGAHLDGDRLAGERLLHPHLPRPASRPGKELEHVLELPPVPLEREILDAEPFGQGGVLEPELPAAGRVQVDQLSFERRDADQVGAVFHEGDERLPRQIEQAGAQLSRVRFGGSFAEGLVHLPLFGRRACEFGSTTIITGCPIWISC
jgi:hypothetical protein